MAKKYSKRKAKAAAKEIKKLPVWMIVTALILAIIIGVGYYLYVTYYKKPDTPASPPAAITGELEFHFMMLGNDNAGDCIYVKAGDNDILIDAGSKSDSIDDIKAYIDNYVTDNTLEYVIITHAHEDHYAGFTKKEGSIFDLYVCETIIDFAKTNQKETTASNNKSQYGYYLDELNAEVAAGAKHYNALQCYNNDGGAQRTYTLADGVSMEILYNYYYENKDGGGENNYSVCVMFHHGDRQFLFTGDLEEEGEIKLAEKYDFTQVEFFKAGHHGSTTSSHEILLKEIKPKICVVPCCVGSAEYYQGNLDTLFPSQEFIDRISKYTDKVYAPITISIKQDGTLNDGSPDYVNDGEPTLLNGNIVVKSEAGKDVYVECSNNDTVLKDTEWYKSNRTSNYWDNANAA